MKIRLFTIPNFITMLNLIAGCLAIVSAINGELATAFYLIIAAAIFDFFDGFAARLLKSYSEVGKQLDSLADMVSFGAAPAMILFSMINSVEAAEYYGWAKYLVFFVAAFSALRLAKFNIDDRQTSEFVGLPTPACSLLIASIGYIFGMGTNFVSDIIGSYPWLIIVLALALSWLLVSEIVMFSFKFKTYGIKDNILKYTFAIGSAAAIAIINIYAIPLIIIAYIVVSIVRHIPYNK